MVSSRMILDTRAQRRNVQRFKKTIQFSRLESNHLMMLSFKMIPDTGVGNCLPKRYRTFFRSRKVKEEPLDVLVSPVPSLITTILISAILYTTFISGATQGTRNMKYESIKFGGATVAPLTYWISGIRRQTSLSAKKEPPFSFTILLIIWTTSFHEPRLKT